MDVPPPVPRAYRAAIAVAGAVLASLAAYVIAEEIVRAVLRPFRGLASPAEPQVLRYAFYGGAVLAVVALRVVRAVLSRPARGAAGEGERAARLARAAFITLALAEIPAILGLVLFLLGGFNRDFYVLVFVSLVLVFMSFPRRSQWEDELRGRPSACPF